MRKGSLSPCGCIHWYLWSIKFISILFCERLVPSTSFLVDKECRWIQLFSIPTIGTPPLGKHVAHSSWWRVARAISRTIIIRILLKICRVRISYPEPLKERQTTFQLLLSKEEQTTLAERRHPDSLHNTSG